MNVKVWGNHERWLYASLAIGSPRTHCSVFSSTARTASTYQALTILLSFTDDLFLTAQKTNIAQGRTTNILIIRDICLIIFNSKLISLPQLICFWQTIWIWLLSINGWCSLHFGKLILRKISSFSIHEWWKPLVWIWLLICL